MTVNVLNIGPIIVEIFTPELLWVLISSSTVGGIVTEDLLTPFSGLKHCGPSRI